MKKEIAKVVESLNKLNINNIEDINAFKATLNSLPFEELEDQHPYNARLVLLKSFDALNGEAEGEQIADFNWCKDFFKRAMNYLYADLNKSDNFDTGITKDS